MRVIKQGERLQKAIHRTNSALVHAKALYEEMPDDELNYVIGHLQQAFDKLQNINYALHHDGKTVTQMELF